MIKLLYKKSTQKPTYDVRRACVTFMGNIRQRKFNMQFDTRLKKYKLLKKTSFDIDLS